jgi:hypothetical protein
MKQKKNDIELYSIRQKITIALISETWLRSELDYLKFNDYTMYRKYRGDGYGGERFWCIKHWRLKKKERKTEELGKIIIKLFNRIGVRT